MTNAWIQRLLVLGLPVGLWVLAYKLWPGYPIGALISAIAPLWIVPALEALQFALLWRVNRVDASRRASLVQHVQAWLGEVSATFKVFMWWQPFRRMAVDDNLTSMSQQPGVVLVHGFACNRALWTRWMRRLRNEKRVFIAVDLEPAFGSIDAYIEIIAQAVQQVRSVTGLPPILVGHSMGGLAIRAWLAQTAPMNSASDAQKSAYRVITLGTPHHGTWLGKLSITTNGTQMQLNSEWLKDLERREAAQTFSNFVCFYSNCDNIVFPVSTAKLEAADNRLVPSVGHVALIDHSDVIEACWHLMQ